MPVLLSKEVSEIEKHSCNVSAISKIGNNIVSGSDDGVLKLWTPDLKLISEVDTKCGAVLSLDVSDNEVFTCTSDETIQTWDRKTLQNTGQIKTSLFMPLKLFYEPATKILWAGDSHGRVGKFQNMTEVNKFELTEEIWDLFVLSEPTIIFTARDRDVLVSEIVVGNLRSNAVVKATVSGRYPVLVDGDIMVCLQREGRNIQVHENSIESKYKLIREIPASELIINTLLLSKNGSVWAGGYDGIASLWNSDNGQSLGSVNLGCCINAYTQAEKGVYAALTDGRIVLVENI